MAKCNRFGNVKFVYVYSYEKIITFTEDNEEIETIGKTPVAVICTGKVGTEFHGKVGVAICGLNDKFVKRIGQNIAYNRLINNAPIPEIGKTINYVRRWNGNAYNVLRSYKDPVIYTVPFTTVKTVNQAVNDIVYDIIDGAISNEQYAEYLSNVTFGYEESDADYLMAEQLK
jgi:hypothetical protein